MYCTGVFSLVLLSVEGVSHSATAPDYINESLQDIGGVTFRALIRLTSN